MASFLVLAGLVLLVYVIGRYAPLFDGQATLEIDRHSTIDVAAGASREPTPRRVLLVSMDGLAPRVLDRVSTPYLDRLAAEGVRARHAETVVPPITMTSHASMLSGLAPEEHGVFFNRVEPWRKLGFRTLFSDCAERGWRCGLFAGKKKFFHFAHENPGVERYRFGADHRQVVDLALAWASERKPDFLFLHFAEVDLTGHQHGWDSEAQTQAIRALDASLAKFVPALQALEERPLSVLVTADHGGTGTGHSEDRPENREIPWILWGPGASAAAPPDLAHVSTLQTYATLKGLLAGDAAR